uniref:Uncharacterized protein n=1 Tax=Pseudomonas syringae TaxID=317 RepID=I3W2E4_PSESX|nr:hypothetical protein [Pseudomonas syringae]
MPPVASSLRIVLQDDLPAPPQSPVQLIVIEWTQEPDGLPAARTSRKGRCAQKTPCPITCHRVSLALPRPSEADEQTTNPARSRTRGFDAVASDRAFRSVCFPLPPLGTLSSPEKRGASTIYRN